jgi:hypothetical protein
LHLAAIVREQIEALSLAATDRAAKLIRREPDPVMEAIVGVWPRDFDALVGQDAPFARLGLAIIGPISA